jgi:DNA-binding NarL/FixJ family response regulator
VTALRVLIADDHAPTRAGVRLALEAGGCEVCAEAATADDAIDDAMRERPDVCVLDLGMPGDGIRAVAAIAAALPDVAVLVLTVSDSSDDLFDALTAGAAGYLLKDMDPGRLPEAVRAAAAGEGTLAGVLTARLIEEFRHRGGRSVLPTADGRSVRLSEREWEVLELLGAGASTADIARRLFLSQVTVRRHVSNILHKLGLPDRDAARRLLARRGSGPPPSAA